VSAVGVSAHPFGKYRKNIMTTLSAVPDDGSARVGSQPSSLRLEVEFAALSVPGRNEDFLGHYAPSTPAQARSHGWLFTLAHGVHGSAAVEYLTSGFRRSAPSEGLSALLMRLAQEANAQLGEPGVTSLAVCVFRYDRVVVAHAGHARCYLIRRQQARLLTRDHTAEVHAVPNAAADADSFASIETSDIQVYPGDVLLLCSDGLHHSVQPLELTATAGSGADLDCAARQLVDLAAERAGDASISVQLMRVRSVERLGMHQQRAYRLR
jgi:hypothetical protein